MGSLLITLIIGGVIGWLASIPNRADGQMGILANVIVGIIGSAVLSRRTCTMSEK
jgi:uncharacterized membrane protein YeaQ/YmgE (transglycosylase-associated protein family)